MAPYIAAFGGFRIDYTGDNFYSVRITSPRSILLHLGVVGMLTQGRCYAGPIAKCGSRWTAGVFRGLHRSRTQPHVQTLSAGDVRYLVDAERGVSGPLRDPGAGQWQLRNGGGGPTVCASVAVCAK